MVSYVEPQQVAKMMVGEKRMNGNSVGIECERYIKNTRVVLSHFQSRPGVTFKFKLWVPVFISFLFRL